jgi:hypothetical protein
MSRTNTVINIHKGEPSGLSSAGQVRWRLLFSSLSLPSTLLYINIQSSYIYTLLRKLQAKNECLLLEDLAQSCVRGKAGGKEKDVAKGQTRYMYRSKCAHIERDLDAAFRTPGASSRELCVCVLAWERRSKCGQEEEEEEEEA